MGGFGWGQKVYVEKVDVPFRSPKRVLQEVLLAIRADIPGQKLRAVLESFESKPLKNKHLGADIHDPNAQTSITSRGGAK